MKKYDHKKIEKKWQAFWEQNESFFAKENSKKPKKFVLIEFPYPSGAGLHMGHLRPYTAGDVYSRYFRLKGCEVLYPIGWDAFGLPAENYAIKMGVHPSITTQQNIDAAKKQLKSWGMSFDWNREVNTTDPEYYKWTQWLFLQFFKKGLAYEATGLINWCPKDKTGLANEEVIDGKCERCGTQVEKKELRQWYLKITAYAEKLLQGLKNDLPLWPESVKLQQENWIGKSTGAEIDFRIKSRESRIKRFVLLHGKGGDSEGVFLPWLKNELEQRGFEVQVPNLPNPEAPEDIKQAEYAKLNCTFDENTLVLGHSFGGIVILRLLEMGVKVSKVVLISTPISGKFLDKKPRPTVTKTCKKGFDFETIKHNAKEFAVLFDCEDDVVPLSDGKDLAQSLEVALNVAKGEEPHFRSKKEPEILNLIAPSLKIFTTRPDTIFGATYMVVAPEHPIIEKFKDQILNYKEVQKYVQKAREKSEIDRTAEEKEKTGVELEGVLAINPATKEEIPVWVADYVLWGYGTGAIMAVPAHDERDFAFAKKYTLPIIQVIQPQSTSQNIEPESAYTGEGVLVNSGKFDGMKSSEAIPEMAEFFGKATVQYKIRDWVFSRQRYWGEPIPLIHCEDCGIVPVPDKDLPVELPNVKKYEPTGTGESPLANITDWVKTKCPKCKKLAWRETNTMPQWAGSSWYWLRYADSENEKEFASKKKLDYWQPVDVYFGGLEHTTLHLLYSRFWNLFLYDQGLVTAKEPYVLRKPHGIVLAADGEKMSKSRGNVVNPDDIVNNFGADTLRMYEMFLGPHETQVSWNDQGVVGVKRFLDRVWAWVTKRQESKAQENDSEKVDKAINRLTKKITEDIENFRFNTAISAYMEFHNEIKDEPISVGSVQKFLILLYPFAPHIAEELNSFLGFKQELGKEKWPEYDPSKIVDKEIEIIVQINGKLKSRIKVASGSGQDSVRKQVEELEVVKKALVGETIKRVVFVKDRLINLVI